MVVTTVSDDWGWVTSPRTGDSARLFLPAFSATVPGWLSVVRISLGQDTSSRRRRAHPVLRLGLALHARPRRHQGC